jgi:hypothetical protein
MERQAGAVRGRRSRKHNLGGKLEQKSDVLFALYGQS